MEPKFPDTRARKARLYLNFPMQYQHEQVFELPQGWTWLGSKQNEAIKSPAFDYERSIAQNGQSVAIKQSIRFNEDHVAVANLPDFFTKMRDVRDGMSRRFILSLPAAAQDKDRDARLKNILRDVMDSHK